MSDEIWLSDEQRSAWVEFIGVVEKLPGVFDTQLQRDASLTHFEYFVLAMLSESPNRVMRMTQLATVVNATLPRLSHVISRLEKRGFVARSSCAEDRRATNARLTDIGWEKVVETAPGHVGTVREYVIDPLTAADVKDLERIMSKLLSKLDSSPPRRRQ